MKILILGASGFVGGHLMRGLADTGKYHIIGLDRRDLESAVPPQAQFIRADVVNDQSQIRRKISESDVAINLMAESFVHDSHDMPYAHLSSNVIAALRLIDTMREARWRGRLIHFSSCEVYGDTPIGGANEDVRTAPLSTYAGTKLAGEDLVATYARAGFVDAIILRPFNLFGPGQQRNRLIPSVLRHITSKSPVPIHDDGRQVRDWLYIDELVTAILLLLEVHPISAEPNIFNISAHRPHSVNQVVSRIASLMDVPQPHLMHQPRMIRQIRRSEGVGSKCREKLGWRPMASFDQLLSLTIDAELSAVFR